MPLVSTRFGEGAAKRLALQFAYEYFKRTETLDLFDAIFEATWDSEPPGTLALGTCGSFRSLGSTSAGAACLGSALNPSHRQ
jgi:hypothetical protein